MAVERKILHYIYCYTNKINGHKYIGQTNNIKRRNREHYSNSYNEKSCSYESLFHKKVREYGWENFKLTILEKIKSNDQELINKKEISWIEKLGSFRGTGKGYNSDKGGSQAKECKVLTNEQLIEVKNKIKQGVCFSVIALEFSISISFISSINNGIYWKDENESYPLYQYYKTNEDYAELVHLLLNSDLSFRKIAEMLNIGESTVKKINYGTLRKGLYHEYPIRAFNPAKRRANSVKELLLKTALSKEEILNKVKISSEILNDINTGKTYYDKNLTYPLRNL